MRLNNGYWIVYIIIKFQGPNDQKTCIRHKDKLRTFMKSGLPPKVELECQKLNNKAMAVTYSRKQNVPK